MNRRVVVAACLIGAALMAMGVTGRQPEEGADRAGTLMAEIVEARKRCVDAILLQNQLISDAGPERDVLLLDAVEELADARVRLARHLGDRGAEELALAELLDVMRKQLERTRVNAFQWGRVEMATVEARALEAELRMESFRGS